MPKLAPFPIIIRIGPDRPIFQLKNEGSASATREEVAADEGFEDAGLAAALATDYGNLREADLGEFGAAERSKNVLELVDYWYYGGADCGGLGERVVCVVV